MATVRHAGRLSSVLPGLAFVVVLWVTVDGLVPPWVLLAAVAFGVVALYGRRKRQMKRETAVAAATVAALAVCLVTAWLVPLSDVGLPDIGVLGLYTYLATEILFGTIAAGLLLRAGRDAIASAARTIAVVYPVAYLWDWYTLEVGVFAIPLRTGVELFGIPLEEHLFMVVVPAFVLGVHETLRARDEGD